MGDIATSSCDSADLLTCHIFTSMVLASYVPFCMFQELIQYFYCSW